jgi:hypothetical protein
VNHWTTHKFWACYAELSPDVQTLADKQFALLKSNPRHSSLQFKKVGKLWSARVNLGVRALAVEDGNDFIWFWIGQHREYEILIRTLSRR